MAEEGTRVQEGAKVQEGTKLQDATKPKRTFAEFLQSTPPNTREELVDVMEVVKGPGPDYYVAQPDI
jgi:hypothetical protein